ncbi:MAG: hypothetical protein JO116_22525 [Planctomycetaceae bacterium]|nr:hypothetical protein [Planctomycetaceae bacterium]
MRCWRVTSAGRRRQGWLIGARPGRGPAGQAKSPGSTFVPEASLAQLVESAHRRHWVERSHEEATGLLGWARSQGRLGSGSPRPAVSVMLASSFLVWREWHERQERSRRGRPRRPVSPSAGPPAGVAAGGASPGDRLAAV